MDVLLAPIVTNRVVSPVDLADERTAGAYQGLSTMGYAVATMVAPLLVTTTVISHGPAGWAMLAGLFVLVGLAFAVGARRWAPHGP